MNRPQHITITWEHDTAARVGIVRALILAVAVTAALFLALPLAQVLAPMPAGLTNVTIPLETLPPPALPPPLRPPPAHAQALRAPTPMPRLSEPRQTVPTPHAPVQMAFALRDAGPGDFEVDFPIAQDVVLAAPPGEFVFEIAETDRMPRPLARLAPMYPPQARMRRIEGEAVVEFVVSPAGAVTDAQIVYAQPQGVFDVTALQAVMRWRFEPGLKDGQAVAVRVRQKLTFKLED